ncbi:hypothetical protein I3760_04G107900 [Carya illinoinensis]|nr:hypothetical protein I3760_04G107900 [Carya illinoinensis]
MYHCVPDFEMDDDYSFPSSSGAARPRKSSLPEDEIMELLWQNGQVVMHSQNQRSMRRSPPSKYDNAVYPADQSANREIRSSQEEQESAAHQQQHFFMQEDEMASWLHYPLVDDDPALDHNFCADLLYPTPNQSNNITNTNANPVFRTSGVTELRQKVTGGVGTSRPPIPPGRRTDLADSNVQNFVHFSRPSGKLAAGVDKTRPLSSKSKTVVRESTVVDSSETPVVGPESWTRSAAEASDFGNRGCPTMSCDAVAGTSSAGAGGKEMMSCEVTLTSSSGCSSGSGSAEPARKLPVEYNRKRKGIEAEDADCHCEDVEFESAAVKKQVHGSTSTKRSRAAEVHNLSERRRRDRINEKMKALQELIPRCNKFQSDKASMLDEAIEYLKSLQLQVQMMSMGCGMVPMMFPGVQQYMPAMGMGIGMGMGMDMGRSMMPFPNMLAGSALQTSAAAAHLGPRYPIPAFHMPPVPAPDPSRIHATNRPQQMLHSIGTQHTSQPRFPNFVDPYQQYVATHQMQLPRPQNQALAQPSTSKPNTIKGPEIPDNHQSGT